MAHSLIALVVAFLATCSLVAAHQSIWHPSVYGFNESTAPYRLVDPLMDMTFDEWWFHGKLDQPPNDGDVMALPAGGTLETEISCDKGYTSYYATSAGGDIRSTSQPDYPCPNQPLSEFHTTGIDDLGGCALAIAYNSDATTVQPEDFVIFSVNQTCPWYMHTNFEIPAAMPECPDGLCTCAWFWIHTPDSGSEQMYMTGFRCNVTGATSTTALATPQLARRCGEDKYLNRAADPSNCTYGAKQPMYWYQSEGNTFFEDTYNPPLYNDLYNFIDGAQNDIFQDSVLDSSTTYTASSYSATATSSGSSSSSDSPSGSSSFTATTSVYYPSSSSSAAVVPTESYPSSDTTSYYATSSATVVPTTTATSADSSATALPTSSDNSPAPTYTKTDTEATTSSSPPAFTTPATKPSGGVSKRYIPQTTSPAMRKMHRKHERLARQMQIGTDSWGSWGKRRGLESGVGEEEEI